MAGEKTTLRTDQQRSYYNTTAYWNDSENRKIVPEKYAYVIYSDAWQRTENGQTVNIPAVKIGDGVTRVIDLPFLGEYESQVIIDHINDNVRHITQQERERWNSKLNMPEYEVIGTKAILTRD
jgi:hypothetical protein